MARRKLKLSKSFIGRVVAVGLFVGLGTFAVIQSINGKKKESDDDNTTLADVDTESVEAPDVDNSQPADSTPTIAQSPTRPASFDQEISDSSTNQLPPENGIGNSGGNFSPNNMLPADSLPQNTLPDRPAGTNQFPGDNNALPTSTDLIKTNPPNKFDVGHSGTSTGNPSGGSFSEPPPLQSSDSTSVGLDSVGNQDKSSSFTPGYTLPPPNSFPSDLSNDRPSNDRPSNANALGTETSNVPTRFGDNNTSQLGSNTSTPSAPKTFGNPNFSGSTPEKESDDLPSNNLPVNSFQPGLPTNSGTANGLPQNGFQTNGQLPSQHVPSGSPSSSKQEMFSNELRSVPDSPNTVSTDTSPPELPQNNFGNNQFGNGSNTIPGNSTFQGESSPSGSRIPPATSPTVSSFDNSDGPSRQNSVSNPVGRSPNTMNQNSIPSNREQFQNTPPQNLNSIVSSRIPAAPATNLLTKQNLQTNPRIEGVQTPSLTLQKLAPREIQVNQSGDFELVVRNVGQTSAANVVVFDKIPANVQVVNMDPQPTSNQNGTVSWNLGELKPAQEKRIKLQLKPTAQGEIDSVAQVTFTALAGARTKITKPILSVSHTAPAKSLIGDNVILDIIVENKGDGPATNVVVQETVPAQLKYVTRNGEEKEIEYVIGTLLPGQKRRIPLTLTAHQVGHLRNQVIAHADGQLSAQHALEMDIVAPTIGVTATGHNRRLMGRPAVHTFTVKNTGTAAATNVELVTKLPRGVRFQSANHHGQYNPTTHSVVWSLAELGPRIEGSVELTTIPVAAGDQTIDFVATADLNQRESTQVSYNAYQVAELYFEIDDVTDALEIGADTVYSIRVVNQGAKAATNVQLAVDFAGGLKPFQVDGGALPEANGQKVQMKSLPSLGPGQEKRFTIRAKAVSAGDHRVIASLSSDDRQIAIKKEEVTHVYADNAP